MVKIAISICDPLHLPNHGCKHVRKKNGMVQWHDATLKAARIFCIMSRPGSPTHDLTTTSGMVAAVITLLSIAIGGLVHLATVCTSFVFINSATHGRSMWCPEGAGFDYVHLGTVLASRSSLLALVSWALGSVWVLEQPSTSCMLYLPSWQSVIKYFQDRSNEGWPQALVLRNAICMAAFRGPTLKPTALWSTESLDLLMNMPVPPKTNRPPAQAPVSYVSLSKF